MVFSKWICTKSMFVKIVYPGGQVELHEMPILAAEIMSRNPRCVVAHPQVFQQPWAIVAPRTLLMPGHKFYVVPLNTIRKLQKLSNKPRPVFQSPTSTSQFQISQKSEELVQEIHSDHSGACWFFTNKTKTTCSSINHNLGIDMGKKGTKKADKNRCTSNVTNNTNDGDGDGDNIDCGDQQRRLPSKSKSPAGDGDHIRARTRKRSIRGHAKGSPKRRIAVFDQWQPSLESIDETDDE